jgi:hypothetical protein
MPVPIIVAGAAAIAARLAAKKVAQEVAKKAAKVTAAKTAQIAKNSVKVKPAAKPVGNPVNQEKSIESMISSASRGGLKTGGTLGKGRDHRVANSKQLKWEPNSRKMLDEISAMKKTKTVKINSASNKTADTARAAALRAEKNKALARSAKGKTQTPTAEAARRRNLNK